MPQTVKACPVCGQRVLSSCFHDKVVQSREMQIGESIELLKSYCEMLRGKLTSMELELDMQRLLHGTS